jgi:hypothetical protein
MRNKGRKAMRGKESVWERQGKRGGQSITVKKRKKPKRRADKG